LGRPVPPFGLSIITMFYSLTLMAAERQELSDMVGVGKFIVVIATPTILLGRLNVAAMDVSAGEAGWKPHHFGWILLVTYPFVAAYPSREGSREHLHRRWCRRRTCIHRFGFCGGCGGPVAGDLDSEAWVPAAARLGVLVCFSCSPLPRLSPIRPWRLQHSSRLATFCAAPKVSRQ
jgi:hypothetical protein